MNAEFPHECRGSRWISEQAAVVNLLRFRDYMDDEVELVVCMTDTLLHLDSVDDVQRLFIDVFAALEVGGMLIVTFRDLTGDLKGLDRFVPVRSDADIIFTCFLEYEPHTVRVHDLVYRRKEGMWEFSKSFYRKLRLSPEWVTDRLVATGFADVPAKPVNRRASFRCA